MVTLKPGSRTQAQHFDNLSVTTLYLQNSSGVLTEVTATADDLNAKGERLKVANKTGSSLAAGTLVYISGYDATLAAPEVTEADADYVTKAAQFVLPAAIANGATGYAEASYTITGLNTSGAGAVDDPVYLSATAGGWTLSAPTGDRIVQKVGVVKVKHASTGEIYFFPGESAPEKIGTSGLQTDSVDKTIIAADVAGAGLVQNVDGSLEVGEGTGIYVAADSISTKDTGQMAVGTILFGATGDCTSVEIGAVSYPYDVAPDVTAGEWEYGLNAGASATNLAAAINGDTRNAGSSYYTATVNTDTVHVYAKTVGTAGNVSIVRTGGAQPATVEALTGGVAAATKQFTIVFQSLFSWNLPSEMKRFCCRYRQY